jgi:hypothetical protein
MRSPTIKTVKNNEKILTKKKRYPKLMGATISKKQNQFCWKISAKGGRG